MEHQVTALTGTWARLLATDGRPSAVLLTRLVSADDFALLSEQEQVRDVVIRDLAGVPEGAAAQARFWEQHVVEVETGLPPGAEAGAVPRPEYDAATRTLTERELAKVAELDAMGVVASARTIQRMRRRYREQGLRGLVDTRSNKARGRYGRTDSRVVEAIQEIVAAEAGTSTGTRDRLRWKVKNLLDERYGPDAVPVPSKSTFGRLMNSLTAGHHTFGSAKNRRSVANRPAAPFSVTWAARPGQQVQIDTTTLDVMALFDDGQARRVELTAAIDIATRTICAAVLRPVGTKAVDASLLLARTLVPEPMRPGWADTLRMTGSRLPHRQLAEIDARLKDAAAKPVVIPETIVCDRGKVYLSQAFIGACRSLGISVQPAHPQAPTDKGVIEATFDGINTLFCQYVAGYTGRDVTRRGAAVDREACWSMAQLQELLDEWVVIGWQQRPHEGLLSPDTARPLSPNEMFAALVTAAGYVPLMLTGEDYIELLPVAWRTINDYGVRLDRRTYDDQALNLYRRQHSGVSAKRGLWEVRYDPYDLTQIWVRNHHDGGWLRIPWTHLPMVAAPFADFTWQQARKSAAASLPDRAEQETAAASALNDLLNRANQGPDRDPTHDKVAARTRAASSTHRPDIEPVMVDAGTDDDFSEDDGIDSQETGTVIPFGVFDARAEAERWP
ncbi:Mu transposase C-terminal domain-containing protein [Actinomadura harenae]|nr:Mu transposase C-terminal domain-containing protein [Actinomadura harenae]